MYTPPIDFSRVHHSVSRFELVNFTIIVLVTLRPGLNFPNLWDLSMSDLSRGTFASSAIWRSFGVCILVEITGVAIYSVDTKAVSPGILLLPVDAGFQVFQAVFEFGVVTTEAGHLFL